MAAAAHQKRASLRADWAILHAAVPSLRRGAPLGPEDYLRAGAAVCSRQMFLGPAALPPADDARRAGLPRGGAHGDAHGHAHGPELGIVPLADMLNHQWPAQTRWHLDAASRCWVLVSLVPLRAGQQLTLSYGRRPVLGSVPNGSGWGVGGWGG